MNFAESPIQSHLLAGQGIVSPPPLSDDAAITEPETRRIRKREGIAYKRQVKVKLSNAEATPDDLDRASSYVFSTSLADNLSAVRRTLPGIAAAELAELLAPRFNQIDARMIQINARTIEMNARMTQMEARRQNAFVERDEDIITPFEALPATVNDELGAVQPIPSVFPLNKGALMELDENSVDQLLGYYDLPIIAEELTEFKIRRLALHLGLPPMR